MIRLVTSVKRQHFASSDRSVCDLVGALDGSYVGER